jgi:hypothetical protein
MITFTPPMLVKLEPLLKVKPEVTVTNLKVLASLSLLILTMVWSLSTDTGMLNLTITFTLLILLKLGQLPKGLLEIMDIPVKVSLVI